MEKIAVLLTVHNRKEKTLKCLQRLNQQLPIEGYQLDTYLTDDGCTDGTSEVVHKEFPEVHIIQGDGTLFWNRGMWTAWNEAVKHKDYDYYLWLNDDTILLDHSVKSLLDSANDKGDKCIIVGSCFDEQNNWLTYGGYKSKKIVSPSNNMQCVDYFNGNVVLIPKYVYHIVGMNDYRFRHIHGDFDYGLRAKKKGIISYIAPNAIGLCNRHSSLPKWCDPKVKFRERYAVFYTPLGYNPFEGFVCENRHHGLIVATFHFFTNYLRLFFPILWSKR